MGGQDSQIRSAHICGWHLLPMFGFRVGTYFQRESVHHRRSMLGLLIQIKAVIQEERVPSVAAVRSLRTIECRHWIWQHRHIVRGVCVFGFRLELQTCRWQLLIGKS
jgi:hypothetical protein